MVDSVSDRDAALLKRLKAHGITPGVRLHVTNRLTMNSFYEQVVALSLCTFLDLSPKQSESGLQIDENVGGRDFEEKSENQRKIRAEPPLSRKRIGVIDRSQVQLPFEPYRRSAFPMCQSRLWSRATPERGRFDLHDDMACDSHCHDPVDSALCRVARTLPVRCSWVRRGTFGFMGPHLRINTGGSHPPIKI